MRKRFLATAVCVTAISMLAACGNTNNNTPTTTPSPTVTQQPTSTPEPTVAPVADTDATEQIQEIYEAVKKAYGEAYWPNMQVQGETTYMSETYGLDESWYDAAVAEISMISANVDTFIIIHATEGNLENVQKALTKYQDYLKNDSMQYPMNLPKVQGSRLETVGNYVCFMMLGQVDETAYDSDEEMITAFSELNQIAVDEITKIVNPGQAQ